MKLQEVLDFLEKKYKLVSRDVIFGTRPLYLSALGKANEMERKRKMEMEISELCEVDPEEHSYVDLTVTFA